MERLLLETGVATDSSVLFLWNTSKFNSDRLSTVGLVTAFQPFSPSACLGDRPSACRSRACASAGASVGRFSRQCASGGASCGVQLECLHVAVEADAIVQTRRKNLGRFLFRRRRARRSRRSARVSRWSGVAHEAPRRRRQIGVRVGPSATRNIAPRPHQTRKLVGADMPLEMQLAERDRDQVVGHGGNARMAIILITSSNLVEPLRRAGDNYSLEILLAR
jgi:hypothetical protein